MLFSLPGEHSVFSALEPTSALRRVKCRHGIHAISFCARLHRTPTVAFSLLSWLICTVSEDEAILTSIFQLSYCYTYRQQCMNGTCPLMVDAYSDTRWGDIKSTLTDYRSPLHCAKCNSSSPKPSYARIILLRIVIDCASIARYNSKPWVLAAIEKRLFFNIEVSLAMICWQERFTFSKYQCCLARSQTSSLVIFRI